MLVTILLLFVEILSLFYPKEGKTSGSQQQGMWLEHGTQSHQLLSLLSYGKGSSRITVDLLFAMSIKDFSISCLSSSVEGT